MSQRELVRSSDSDQFLSRDALFEFVICGKSGIRNEKRMQEFKISSEADIVNISFYVAKIHPFE